MRTTFDAVAEDYQRVRPTYPAEVFDDLVALARLSPGARLLEVGCGTGQATLPLAERGFNIVAVELGERMASLTRRRAVGFPAVHVLRGAFEDWEPAGADEFDAVVSFAAFHWVDPRLRYAKGGAPPHRGGRDRHLRLAGHASRRRRRLLCRRARGLRCRPTSSIASDSSWTRAGVLLLPSRATFSGR